MSTTVENAVRGTVKVGRWTYPAVRTDSGEVARNTKRDGSGGWVDAPVDAFVADESGVPAQGDAPNIEGFTEDGHSDYDDLRIAYRFIFDQFGTDYAEIADKLGCDEARAKAIVSMLKAKGLVVTDTVNDTGLVVQSLKTYDNHTADEVMADFAEAFNPGVKIRRSSGHGGKVGAQHKKPGKSTWQIGTACPQGHRLTEENLYVMPSGRKQCRDCRHGYPSNMPKPGDN